MFPNAQFYGVYFSRWPRAIKLPSQLSNENVVCIGVEGEVEAIQGQEGLRKFLSAKLARVTDDEHARLAALASLWLAAFAANGGPYQLDNPKVSVARRDDRIVASAFSAVKEPSRGDIGITLAFTNTGDVPINGIKITGQPHSGPPS